VRRREFIAGLGGAAAWPMVARAQQTTMPVIGFLSAGSPDTYSHYVTGFREGLNEAGYAEGRNVAIEFRWSRGENERLATLAVDLIGHHVAMIVASGGPSVALAAKVATSTIPIVFSSVDDPINLGLVDSLNRPGRNATGTSLFRAELTAKQMELLRELVPGADVIAVLANPNTERFTGDFRGAAHTLGQQIVLLSAGTEAEIDTAFARLAEQRVSALLIGIDPFFNTRRDQLVALAARHRLPTIYQFREFVAAGGLISYGTNVVDVYRQLGGYAGRILKGEKPADLPVMQPTKFELVLNLKTAKALGLDIPATLLARADEVIE
jgi:putative ABC transport system substrate-binding protein